MAVLTCPWADLALFLQESIIMSNSDADSFLPAFGLMLFWSVSLLLLALILFLSWKLKQADADLFRLAQDRSSISAPHRRKCRGQHGGNAGSHSCT